MKHLFEKIFTMTLAMIFIIALTICWVCTVIVSYEIFLPIAGMLTALGAIIVIGGIIERKEK